jgi:hypothetical protein
MTCAYTWTTADEIAEQKTRTRIEKYGSQLAENIKRLMKESLTNQVSLAAPWRGLRMPSWMSEFHSEEIEAVATSEIGSKKLFREYDRWFYLKDAFTLSPESLRRCKATRPALEELFAGDWDGLRDSAVRKRIAAIHGQKIEDCDWLRYQKMYIAPEMKAQLWQGAWYTEAGLAAAQRARGAMLLNGKRGSGSEVLSPYPGMDRREALRFLRWAFAQYDSSADGQERNAMRDDPLLDDRLLQVGQMLQGSKEWLPGVVHDLGRCREDYRLCQMAARNEDLYRVAAHLDWVWRQLPGYTGADLVDM